MMKEDYLEINLLRIVKAIWRRVWLVVLSCVLCASAAFIYARFIVVPTYEASVLMYVNNSSFSLGSTSFSFNASELAAAHDLVNTYSVILKTRTTLNDVISEAGLDMSYERLNSMITTASVNGTEIFRITVTSVDPVQAAEIANTIARVLPTKVASVVEGSSVRTVDYAVVPNVKSSPNVSRHTMIGFVFGAVLACALIIFMELRDDQIHDEETITAISNFPVLASVPDLRKSDADICNKHGKGYYSRKTDGGN